MDNSNSDYSRFLSILSLCKKAGKLAFGFDTVKAEIIKGSTDRAFASEELSPKTLKELAFVCKQYGAELIVVPVSVNEIWFSVSKPTGVLAVRDEGLSLLLKGSVPEIKEDIAQ